MWPAGPSSRRVFSFPGDLMRVLKFGGTSVADAAAIRRLVAIVGARPGPRTVVVSALAGVTDGLLAIAERAGGDAFGALAALEALTARHQGVAAEIRTEPLGRFTAAAIDGLARGAAQAVHAIAAAGRPSPALVDRLLATGELWSSRIVAALPRRCRHPVAVDRRPPGRPHRRTPHGSGARTCRRPTTRSARLVRPALALDRVVVLGGFIGAAPDGATTTLGRGGSDYSAAIVGACLDARRDRDLDRRGRRALGRPRRRRRRARPADAVVRRRGDAGAVRREGAASEDHRAGRRARHSGARAQFAPARGARHADRRDGRRGWRLRRGRVARRRQPGARSSRATSDRRRVVFGARAPVRCRTRASTFVLGEVHGDRLLVAVDRPFDLEACARAWPAFADVRARNGLAAVCAVGDRLGSEPRVAGGAFGGAAATARCTSSRAPAARRRSRSSSTATTRTRWSSRLHDWFMADGGRRARGDGAMTDAVEPAPLPRRPRRLRHGRPLGRRGCCRRRRATWSSSAFSTAARPRGASTGSTPACTWTESIDELLDLDVDVFVELIGGRRAGGGVDPFGARSRHLRRHGEQAGHRARGAVAPRRGGGARLPAALRSVGRRRRAGDPRDRERPGQRHADAGRRHPQRHLQLHPDADGARGRDLRRRAEGGAGARLRRGESRRRTSTASTPRAKLAILAMVAFGIQAPPAAIEARSIANVTPLDFQYAHRLALHDPAGRARERERHAPGRSPPPSARRWCR